MSMGITPGSLVQAVEQALRQEADRIVAALTDEATAQFRGRFEKELRASMGRVTLGALDSFSAERAGTDLRILVQHAFAKGEQS